MKHYATWLAAALCLLTASVARADLTLYVDTTNHQFKFDGSKSTYETGGISIWESSITASLSENYSITNIGTPYEAFYAAYFLTEDTNFAISIETGSSGSAWVTVTGTSEWQSYYGWEGSDYLEAMIGYRFSGEDQSDNISVVQYSPSVPEPAGCAGFAGIAALGAAFAARRIRKK
jgi:hypothetical protein